MGDVMVLYFCRFWDDHNSNRNKNEDGQADLQQPAMGVTGDGICLHVCLKWKDKYLKLYSVWKESTAGSGKVTATGATGK